MMLSEQAKAALERLHNDSILGWRADMHLILRDYEIIREALMGMCPVKTLNGVVIRWDDEITPERLVASGWRRGDMYFPTHKHDECGIEFYFRSRASKRLKCGRIQLIDNERDGFIPDKYVPTNMGEVWNLMAKCGCPVGGVE